MAGNGSIVIDPNHDSRPDFKSEGVFKHLKQHWMVYMVRLPSDTFNPDQYKGECIIDGRRHTVVAVERKPHMPPWLKGELIGLAVRM